MEGAGLGVSFGSRSTLSVAGWWVLRGLKSSGSGTGREPAAGQAQASGQKAQLGQQGQRAGRGAARGAWDGGPALVSASGSWREHGHCGLQCGLQSDEDVACSEKGVFTISAVFGASPR